MRVTVMVSVPPVSCHSSSLPPPSGSLGPGALLAFERVLEFDAVDDLVLEALADRDVELIAIAIACTQTLVALTRLVQRVEVHDQVELVVRAGRHPRVGVGVVRAGLVEDRERLAMTRRLRGDCGRREQQSRR